MERILDHTPAMAAVTDSVVRHFAHTFQRVGMWADPARPPTDDRRRPASVDAP